MKIGRWVFIGAFFGLIIGAMVGAEPILLSYYYPHNPHHDLYPLPIALGNVAGGDALLGILPGALVGYFVGVRVRNFESRRGHEITLESASNPEVWPPPPMLTGPKEIDHSMNYDPIEDNADIQPTLALASDEAHAELAAQGQSGGLGYCHSLWSVKKRILKEKYQVEWRSPGEMNPEVKFD